MIRCYFGHHKCATQWIGLIIRNVCIETGSEFRRVVDHRYWSDELLTDINSSRLDFITYINAKFEDVESLSDFRAFHIIRDPRDILVSAYFSHLNSHGDTGWPALVKHRERLRSCDTPEGLLLEARFSEGTFRDIHDWEYGNPDILEMKYEQLVVDPNEGFKEIFRHLSFLNTNTIVPETSISISGVINKVLARSGQKAKIRCSGVSERRLSKIVSNASFSKLSGGRKKGEEDKKHHYRKGVAGDWRNYFTPAVKSEFKKLYGDLLIKTGYEESNDW